jgi:hypothetical protein
MRGPAGRPALRRCLSENPAVLECRGDGLCRAIPYSDWTNTGDLDHARRLLAPLLAEEPRWARYLELLADLDVAPRARELLD